MLEVGVPDAQHLCGAPVLLLQVLVPGAPMDRSTGDRDGGGGARREERRKDVFLKVFACGIGN